jgi:hypothetical protein
MGGTQVILSATHWQSLCLAKNLKRKAQNHNSKLKTFFV